MSRLWARWVAFLDHQEPATPMALVRIGCALVWLVSLAWVVWTGTADAIWLDADHGGWRELSSAGWRVDALGGARPEVVHPLLAASGLFALLSLVGIGGRFVSFAHLQLVCAITGINGMTGGSYDELLTNGLWVVVLAPSTATLSLDCKLKTGSWTSDTPVPAWARGLIVFQLVLMYSTTGWQKLSAHWTPGGDLLALYYILQQRNWARWDHSWVAYVAPLTQLATLTSWLWEVTGPLWGLAWLRLGRAERQGAPAPRGWWWVFATYASLGLIFHVGIELLMNVGPFGWVSLALYPALWSHETWARVWGRLAGAFTRRSAPSPAPAG